MKTVRTMLYGDCDFDEWELELLHTPIMQRMYDLKQLGFTDRVYPDAIHSRFNHIIGVTARADKIVSGVIRSLRRELNGHLPARSEFKYGDSSIEVVRLLRHVECRRRVVRLIALIHDIAHIPFGHTLEDELNIFGVKHDSPERQAQFFDILVTEFLYTIMLRHDPNVNRTLLSTIRKNVLSEGQRKSVVSGFSVAIDRIRTSYRSDLVRVIFEFLRDLQTSMMALFHLDSLHKTQGANDGLEPRAKAIKGLFITQVLKECDLGRANDQPEFNIFLDAFLLDIIGNTICADLLDYAKRDSQMAGLHYEYDERIFKYFSLVSYSHVKNMPPLIRLALQVFTNKIRHDVISEVVTILRTRYLLSERVIFHPTKCSVGAMLGEAVYLMGIDKAKLDFFRIGDSTFIRMLDNHATSILQISNEVNSALASEIKTKQQASEAIFGQTGVSGSLTDLIRHLSEASESFSASLDKENIAETYRSICLEEMKIAKPGLALFAETLDLVPVAMRISDRLEAATKLVWQIQSRQYYKMIYRVAKIDSTQNAQAKIKLAEQFKDPKKRFELQRRIETSAGLPYGSLLIHCPRFHTMLKGADVLVFGSNPKAVVRLRDIDDEHDLFTLIPYLNEAKSLSEAYKCIWNMYFFLQESWMTRWPFVELKIREALKQITNTEIINSTDLHHQLESARYELAERLIEVSDYIGSDECVRPVKMTPDFVDFVESPVHRAKAKRITPRKLVESWWAEIERRGK